MSRIYEQHIIPASNKMYRYALTILKNEDNAHDVVQECLTKIWDKRHMLKDVQNVEAWAMRVTRNQCYDWVKASRFTTLSEQQTQQEDQLKADHDMLMEDQKKWLAKVLEGIPEKQREIFHLREIEELSYHEISDVLSLSMNEVKVYLHRARTKVRAALQKIEAYGIAN